MVVYSFCAFIKLVGNLGPVHPWVSCSYDMCYNVIIFAVQYCIDFMTLQLNTGNLVLPSLAVFEITPRVVSCNRACKGLLLGISRARFYGLSAVHITVNFMS